MKSFCFNFAIIFDSNFWSRNKKLGDLFFSNSQKITFKLRLIRYRQLIAGFSMLQFLVRIRGRASINSQLGSDVTIVIKFV